VIDGVACDPEDEVERFHIVEWLDAAAATWKRRLRPCTRTSRGPESSRYVRKGRRSRRRASRR
jgi:hypothetical protein